MNALLVGLVIGLVTLAVIALPFLSAANAGQAAGLRKSSRLGEQLQRGGRRGTPISIFDYDHGQDRRRRLCHPRNTLDRARSPV